MTALLHECVERLRGYQQEWAQKTLVQTDDDGYCFELERNLLRPLHPDTRKELEQGDGDELGAAQSRGKLQALHSSSALACNVFDYWRSAETDTLRLALGLGSPISGMRFERKFPTGARSRASLDLVLELFDDSLHAIESKFLEPYDPACDKTTIQPIYFSRTRWTEVGLPEAQLLAEDVRDRKVKVKHLNVAQLLKHMLGLGRQKQQWVLHYIWFDPAGEAAACQRAEIAQFVTRLGSEARHFVATTHNELFQRLRTLVDTSHHPYINYLDSRYFARVVA